MKSQKAQQQLQMFGYDVLDLFIEAYKGIARRRLAEARRMEREAEAKAVEDSKLPTPEKPVYGPRNATRAERAEYRRMEKAAAKQAEAQAIVDSVNAYWASWVPFELTCTPVEAAYEPSYGLLESGVAA